MQEENIPGQMSGEQEGDLAVILDPNPIPWVVQNSLSLVTCVCSAMLTSGIAKLSRSVGTAAILCGLRVNVSSCPEVS